MPHRCVWLACLVLLIPAPALAQDSAQDRSRSQQSESGTGEHLTELVALYHHLHSHPELSFREEETARRIAEELKKTGAEVTTGVGKLGVVGVLKNGPGATVLVRTDLDALPVVEDTGLAYASKVKTTDSTGREVGVMHACGHDIHMTCLVGTARWLAEHRENWSGTVVLIGQPAEELVGGARAMLDDGLYTRFPRPDFALALHVLNELPTGVVGYTVGPTLASSTGVDVTIRGRGGHGAAPHQTADPIVLAALAILDFQTIVSREIDPTQSSVLTVGAVHGGTKHNIIPDEVKLQLTLRAFREDVRDQLIDGIKRRAEGLAQAHRAPAPIVEIRETTPPLISTPSLVARVVPALRRALGEAKVREFGPVMGAEDFGLFGQGGVPTFMFRLGTSPEKMLQEAKAKGEPIPGLHSSKYQPDPAPSIETGVRAMVAAVRELLPH
jgi:hippurate hydrolase